MKTVFFLIPDDLHRQWRVKLSSVGLSGKDVFLTFVQSFVKEDQHGKKAKSKDSKDSKKAEH